MPKPLLARGPAQEARFGALAKEYGRIAFDKKHLKDDATLEWVTPGHPLFEVVRADLIERVGDDLRHGAVFYDLHTPVAYRLDVFAASIKDGRANVLHRRLFVVRVDDVGFSVRQPTIFLDLIPSKGARAPDEAGLPDRQESERELHEQALKDWLVTTRADRERETAIVKRHVEISLNELINRAQVQLGEYEERVDRGDMTSGLAGLKAQAEQHVEELVHRLDVRLQQLDMERLCTIADIDFMGQAWVLPHPDPRGLEDVRTHALDVVEAGLHRGAGELEVLGTAGAVDRVERALARPARVELRIALHDERRVGVERGARRRGAEDHVEEIDGVLAALEVALAVVAVFACLVANPDDRALGERRLGLERPERRTIRLGRVVSKDPLAARSVSFRAAPLARHPAVLFDELAAWRHGELRRRPDLDDVVRDVTLRVCPAEDDDVVRSVDVDDRKPVDPRIREHHRALRAAEVARVGHALGERGGGADGAEEVFGLGIAVDDQFGEGAVAEEERGEAVDDDASDKVVRRRTAEVEGDDPVGVVRGEAAERLGGGDVAAIPGVFARVVLGAAVVGVESGKADGAGQRLKDGRRTEGG